MALRSPPEHLRKRGAERPGPGHSRAVPAALDRPPPGRRQIPADRRRRERPGRTGRSRLRGEPRGTARVAPGPGRRPRRPPSPLGTGSPGLGDPSEALVNPTLRLWTNAVGILFALLTTSAGLIWMERRLLALWQERYGPNRVGPLGLLQVLADMIKIFAKENWVPPFADRPLFVLAPAVIAVTTLFAFAVVPVSPGIGV